jgi:hypothetical protein
MQYYSIKSNEFNPYGSWEWLPPTEEDYGWAGPDIHCKKRPTMEQVHKWLAQQQKLCFCCGWRPRYKSDIYIKNFYCKKCSPNAICKLCDNKFSPCNNSLMGLCLKCVNAEDLQLNPVEEGHRKRQVIQKIWNILRGHKRNCQCRDH